MKVQVFIFSLLVSAALCDECKITRTVQRFTQCDERWGNLKLGYVTTLCDDGSVTTTVATAMYSLGLKINGQAANPGLLYNWLKANDGYKGHMVDWRSLARLGLNFIKVTTSKEEINSYICQNKVVIVSVFADDFWVLATGFHNLMYTVVAPKYEKTIALNNEIFRAVILSY